MSGQQFFYPSFAQRNPLSLILLALAPLTVSLSLATVAQGQEKSISRADTTSANSETTEDTSTSVESDKVTELRVAPLDVVEYPDDRPEWIDIVAEMDGETHTQVAVSQLSDSKSESLASLKLMQRVAVRLYANKLILSDGHLESFVPDESWIIHNMDRFVSEEYEGVVTQGESELYEHAVQLRFTPEYQDEIRLLWKNAEVRDRLGVLGFLVFVGTVLTGCGSAALGVVSRHVERKKASSPR